MSNWDNRKDGPKKDRISHKNIKQNSFRHNQKCRLSTELRETPERCQGSPDHPPPQRRTVRNQNGQRKEWSSRRSGKELTYIFKGRILS